MLMCPCFESFWGCFYLWTITLVKWVLDILKFWWIWKFFLTSWNLEIHNELKILLDILKIHFELKILLDILKSWWSEMNAWHLEIMVNLVKDIPFTILSKSRVEFWNNFMKCWNPWLLGCRALHRVSLSDALSLVSSCSPTLVYSLVIVAQMLDYIFKNRYAPVLLLV